MMEQLAKEAQAAIAQGKQAIADYNYSLQQLQSSSSHPHPIPFGF